MTCGARWSSLEPLSRKTRPVHIRRPPPKKQDLLPLPPNEFILQETTRVRQSQGLDAQGALHMLSQWKVRKYITNHNYRKNRTTELILTRTDKRKIYPLLSSLSMDSEPLCQILEPTWRDIVWGRPGRSRCLFDSRLWLYRQVKKLGEGGADYGKVKRSLRS